MASLSELDLIKASQLEELTEVTDSNYVVVTDGATSKKVKATNLKGNSLTSEQEQQLSEAYEHSQTPHVQSSDIPTKTSDLTNDSEFITSSDLPTVPTKVSDLENDRGYLASIPEEYITETELETKGYLTEHQSLTDYAKKTDIPDVSDFLTEVPEGYVTDTKLSTELDKKVNKEVGKGLSTNDLTNELVIKINSSATEAFVTNAIANAQLGGGEVDLSGYATIDALKLKADLTHTHDQYLTKVPDEYITETELTAKGYLTEHQDISNLALKSEIPDVSSFITSDDLPTVPTKVSDLENDKNYISSIPSEYVTETELNAKGYLTSHQDISELQTKTDNTLTTTDKTVVGAINEVKSSNDTKLNKTDVNKLNCVSIDNVSLKEYILTNFTGTEKTYYLIAKTTCTDLPKASNFFITVETPGLYTYKVTAKELNDSNGIYICTYRTISSSWTAWEKVCTTTVADVTETPIEFDKTALGLTISNNRSIYKVINGICYVTIELLVDAPSENKSYGYTKVNTTNLPKIGFNTKYFINVEGANSTISAVLDKGTTEIKFHGNILAKEGTYIIQGSFSYPVAES